MAEPKPAVAEEPRAETVEALLETTWRLVAAEHARRDAIDRKATSLASFAALVLSLTATLGAQFLELDAVWALTIYLAGLSCLAGAVATAVYVLLPRERPVLGMAYIKRFPSWSEVTRTATEVRGETMRGLVEALGIERALNRRTAQWTFRAFLFLFAGLALLAVQAAIVAVDKVG